MMGKPKIRFKGYNEDWEQRKFSELYKKVNEKNIFRFGVDKIISVANMYFKEDVKKPNDEYMRTYNIMRLGDIAFEGNKSKNFSHGRFVENTIGDGIVSHVFDVFRPVMDYDLLFWKYLINNENVMGRIMTRCTKASTMMTNLVAKDFLNENILVPTIEEQHKIGTYIDKLDHLITLHQRKIYIFIKKMPIDWEQRKLGEVFEQTTNFVNLSKDDIELWSLTVEDGLTPKSERYNREFLVKKDTNFKEVRPGDIVYNPMNMTLGAVGYNGMSKSVAISGYYTTMITKDGNDSYYINTWLKSPQAISLYKIYATGSLIEKQRVQFPTLSTIPAVFPKYEEQHKIGCYFEAIDHLITLHHRKCIILRKMKVNDWEQRKLGEVLVSLQNNTLSRADLSNETGIAKNVHYGDVLIKFGEVLDVSEEKLPMISDKSVLTKYKASFLQNGDVIVADTAEDSTVGKCSEIAGLNDEVVLSGLHTIPYRPIEKFASGYLGYYLNSSAYHKQLIPLMQGIKVTSISKSAMQNTEIVYPKSVEEQGKIGNYFQSLDHLITLHHRKRVILKKTKVSDWEQRKLGEVLKERTKRAQGGEELLSVTIANGVIRQADSEKRNIASEDKSNYKIVRKGDIPYNSMRMWQGAVGNSEYDGIVSPAYTVLVPTDEANAKFFMEYFKKENSLQLFQRWSQGLTSDTWNLKYPTLSSMRFSMPSIEEQNRIASYFEQLDHLITLHHHEEFCTENVLIYIEINKTIQIKEDIMAELESVIEQKLIDQLVYGDSQWTYRADLKTEEDLWNNFRYILVQNNKDRLNGEPLSDTEFEQVKNQLQFSSFYKAGEWLVGENGKVMVHVQRDTERLHLVVMNHEHIAGGSSVYEVINQYRALADEESQTKAQDRRFDVTLMINGLPMIHIELKNKQHSYMDGFWQIKKYIGEGKFTGIFSAVQMFVISNGVDTKYFSAASDTELNSKFISGWLDNENNPVPDYLDFAKSVLRIPEAHEMIARYTVLDEEAKRLILLRPYQIHAIEAIREASKTGKSGFVWHTTGSGKTLTSYKATRNLLMDIPSIDKAIFLIDRKDLDTQTSMAFRTYANNDLVDVDQTDNVFDLKKKLKSDDRQMIVTTIQKLQRLITKKLAEGTPEYNKIKSLKIAFVVDECHRAVTPGTKRELERFFANSLWYGFTGTPRFAENPYPQLGDLPRTTEELYGERLHRYTIQNAIHDNAVLGFQVEHNGPKNMDDETDSSMYENETHMLRVLDVILNKSYHKLGFQNGKGKTYEGLLTTSSIQLAQKYYELLKRVKNGETELQIDEKVKQILPDFPKFAITYSVTENEEGSHLNQEKMKESINDYNEMFGTKLDISQIQSYNANLNKRLARKEPKFQSRSEQLDLVIVVDRLLTGFDAPCMSTLFVDRQPMGPHDLIQAFSRTNRIFDKNKTYGQIVTFQAPKLFKECVDNAVKLYSAGSTEIALLAEWEEIEPAFRKALKALRVSAETPAEIPVMSEKEKVLFVKAFQHFDKLFAQLKSFTQYEDSMLTEYGISEDEYDDYAGHYLNVKEELKAGAEDTQSEMEEQPIDVDYELMAYSNTKIDYEYIINLIQNIVTPDEDVEITPEERQKQLEEVKQYIDDLRKENPKVADIMSTLVSEIEQDEVKYKGQSILNIVENMKHECIEKVVMDFSITWYVSKDDVMYAATHYRNGEIPNESAIKSTADFTSFKEAQERAIPKFKYYNMMIEELRKTLEEEIKPLLNN